jgi:hypothetical protein
MDAGVEHRREAVHEKYVNMWNRPFTGPLSFSQKNERK